MFMHFYGMECLLNLEESNYRKESGLKLVCDEEFLCSSLLPNQVNQALNNLFNFAMVFSPSTFGDLPSWFLMTLDDDQGHTPKNVYSSRSKLANHLMERVQASFLVANHKVTDSTTPFLSVQCASFQLVIHFFKLVQKFPNYDGTFPLSCKAWMSMWLVKWVHSFNLNLVAQPWFGGRIACYLGWWLSLYPLHIPSLLLA